MGFNPLDLMHGIEKDISDADEIFIHLQDEAKLLSEVSTSYELGSGKAIDSFKSVLSDVRLSAVYLYQDANMAFTEDARKDLRMAKKAFGPFGTFFDAQNTAALIQSYIEKGNFLESLLADAPAFIVNSISNLLTDTFNFAHKLEEALQEANLYLIDGTIYSNSTGYISRLNSSANVLQQITYSPQTGVYSLDDIDMSWAPKQDKEYWEQHNKRIISQYFIVDPISGLITGIQPDMESRVEYLVSLIGKCLLSSGVPEEIDKLNSAEKYILTCIVVNGSAAIRGGGALINGFIDVIPGLRALIGQCQNCLKEITNQIGPVGLLTDVSSFEFDHGLLYSVESVNSIQYRNGFSDGIDCATPWIGADLKSHTTTFKYKDGYEYRIEYWTGSYGVGAGYGGEIAIYRREVPQNEHDEYKQMSPEEISENLTSLTPSDVNHIWTTYGPAKGAQVPEMHIVVHAGDKRYDIDGHQGKTNWSFNAKMAVYDEHGGRLDDISNDNLFVTAEMTFTDDPEFAACVAQNLNQDGIPATVDGAKVFVTYDDRNRQ